LNALGAEVFTVSNDLSKEGQPSALVDAVVGHYAKIDILVNNAGATGVRSRNNIRSRRGTRS